MKTERDAGRDFPGKRWLVNALRAAHVVGIVGLGAAVLAETAPAAGFGLLVLLSGLAILGLDAWSRPGYFRENVGVAMLGKLLLFGLLLVWPAQRAPLYWLILVFSVFLSHAPARVRHGTWRR